MTFLQSPSDRSGSNNLQNKSADDDLEGEVHIENVEKHTGLFLGGYACLFGLVGSLDFAPTLDLVQDGGLDSPTGICRVIDGHAVATDSPQRTVFQGLVKFGVISSAVPAEQHQEKTLSSI